MLNRFRITILLVLAGCTLLSAMRAVSQSDLERDVLAANAAFYSAFVKADRRKMDQLWSKHSPVAVIHPTWPGIYGRDDVMESWNQLMRAPRDLKVAEAQAFVLGDTAFVICYEILDGSTTLIATNIFSREGDTWKLVHHQAGSATYAPETGISI